MKSLTRILTALMLLLATTSAAHAAALSIRVESPKSPTNQKNFKLSFVALDINDNSISVVCEKKGPSDGSFTQFDSTKNLPSGGSSGDCQVTHNQISPIGTYQFRAVATSASGVETSNTVSVDYDDSRPGKPGNYGKEKTSDCTFKITFKTADDGKTTKVEVYRSESSNFDLNNSTKVGEVALGPNQNGEFSNTVPDCAKTYYFALRAFDGASNTSDPVGDSGAFTTTTTSAGETPTTNQFGPIAVGSVGGSGGQILGESDEPATSSSQSADTQTNPEEKGAVEGVMDTVTETLKTNNNKVMLGLGALVFAGMLYWYYRSRSQK